MLFKFAWRNIWRNKRRSLITIASIFFAVLFAIFMNSFQKGSWVRMLDNVINFYYGYIQIHQNGYWEEKSINNIMEWDDALQNLSTLSPQIVEVVPRLESFALVSSGTHTSGMMIVGTDPEKENALSNLKSRLVDGAYLRNDDKALILAEGAASVLKVKVGDTLVLLTQGYQGAQAAGKYPIKGVLHFNSPELNKQMLYIPLPEAQNFFGATNMVSSVALKLRDPKSFLQVQEKLEKSLSAENFEVMNWQQILPDLVSAQKSDAAGNYIFLLVLYMIIGFGIFGTVLMMVKEREYEFGVLLAIGMKRSQLAAIVWLEVLFLALIGSILGMIAVYPLVDYFRRHPIDFSSFGEEMTSSYEKWGFDPIFPTVIEAPLFYNQTLIVLVMSSILALYAIWKIFRIKPIDAMRN